MQCRCPVKRPVDVVVMVRIGEIRVFADKISLTLKVDGLKDLASEMAVSGYFYEPHGEPEKFPETAHEVLDDGSIRMTMQLESKKIDGHRQVVIPAPGAEPDGLSIAQIMKNIPEDWNEQRRLSGFPER